ncbi:hypothetical protein ACFQ9Q_38270 [Streptomyces virginiae]|uniref:hypothetical protein n=1 Tax=Streptomyces virginiae TaxID=1961 RepID=UPI0036B782DD
MKKLTRTYTALVMADGRLAPRFVSSAPVGAIVVVRQAGGRPEWFRLTATPLFDGSCVAEPIDFL